LDVLSWLLLAVHDSPLRYGGDESPLDGSGLSDDIRREGRDQEEPCLTWNRSSASCIRHTGFRTGLSNDLNRSTRQCFTVCYNCRYRIILARIILMWPGATLRV